MWIKRFFKDAFTFFAIKDSWNIFQFCQELWNGSYSSVLGEVILVASLSRIAYENPVQYQRKLMMQTWENGENIISGPILAHLAQIWTLPLNFFCGFYLY